MSKPTIKKMLQTINSSSRNGAGKKYIVIHWVGAVSSAKNNCLYFRRAHRGASAHFFVDSKEIWQSVSLDRAAWHCGGVLESAHHPLRGICTNSNSIGIELCCIKQSGKTIVDPAAINRAIPLVKWLMQTYDIPASRVVRHYDVTGKDCPHGYTKDTKWQALKAQLTGSSTKTTSSSSGKTYPGKLPSARVGRNYGTKKDIMLWQAYLCWIGPDVDVDGIFGPDTEAKTKAAQKKLGCTADGIAGPVTLKKAAAYRKAG